MASCLVSEADVEDCHDQGDQQEAREGEEQVEEHQTRSNLLAIQLKPRWHITLDRGGICRSIISHFVGGCWPEWPRDLP